MKHKRKLTAYLPFEIFKPIYINGNKTNYVVSNKGNVYSTNYKNTKTKHEISQRTDKDGYKIVTLYYKGKRYDKKVHRLVAEAFVNNYYDKPEVNHEDTNRANNKANNLSYVTTIENLNWSSKYGKKTPVKDQKRNRKYSDEQVEYVCQLLEQTNLTPSQIKDITKVPTATIQQILNGGQGKHISEKYDFSNRNKMVFTKKLPKKLVKNICKELEKGKMTMVDIARKYDVDVNTVRRIKHHEYYVDISKKYKF